VSQAGGERRSEPEPSRAPASPLEPRVVLGLALAFGALAFPVYRQGLAGGFVSDDFLYYGFNQATASLSLENTRAILDPRSPVHYYTYNYAPLHLLLVALERRLFSAWMPGYHAVQLLLHALNAALFAALLVSSRVPRAAAIPAGAILLLHPAQVESVTWLSELKSVVCLNLGLGSLLCLGRAPRLATALFGLALLTKFSAVAFLPTAAALAWARGAPRATWSWLGAWLALLLAVAAPQLALFRHGGSYEVEVFEDGFEQLRSMAAIGARYLWMAATGLGVSAFHDPDPARSLLDPWWLAGLAAGPLLAWRTAATLRRRREEAAYWVLAAASFVLVSQLVPFRFPMADRYLYFILPGLVGGVWLAGTAACRRLGERRGRAAAGVVGGAACAAASLLAVHFGFQALPRVPLWLGEASLLADAAEHYPEGTWATYLRAVRAAERGDVRGAVEELRRVEERRRLSFIKEYERDVRLAHLFEEAEFLEFLREVARYRIDLIRRRGLRPGEEFVLAVNHARLGEYDTATELIEKQLRAGDPRRAQLLLVLEEIRLRRRQERHGPDASDDPGAEP
jgi:hypothetical protein